MANINDIKIPVSIELLPDVHTLEVYYCDICNQVAKHMISISAGDNNRGITSYIPLCEDCKQRFEEINGTTKAH
jgi:hypothetical protein